MTFRFPLLVAPRYIPGQPLGGDQAGQGRADDTDLVPDASRISPPVMLPGYPNPVRLGIRVSFDERVEAIASSLHAITTTEAARPGMGCELKPGERIDRDFILRWRVDQARLRSSVTCADDADGRQGTFMLTLVPPAAKQLEAKPRDVVFVVDRSGSMGGWKMVAARRAAARMIDALSSRDRFCVLAFDNVVDAIPGSALVDATDRNRFAAIEQLAALDARGGTELAAPLGRAASLLAGGHDDRMRVIVLVTDGQVGNEDHILRELSPKLRNVRVFTLGIDQAVNAAFLRRLAAAGGGLCELVESEDRLDAVMTKVHRRIGTPIATELSVTGTGGFELRSVTPRKLPDVYAGAPVTIIGRYRRHSNEGGSIEVTGSTGGEPLRWNVAPEGPPTTGTWLAASWARAEIRDLEDRYAANREAGLEREIVALSKQHSVLSRFTAFLAVDRSEVVNAGGKVRTIVQPVEAPAGWADTEGAVAGVAQVQAYALSAAMPIGSGPTLPGAKSFAAPQMAMPPQAMSVGPRSLGAGSPPDSKLLRAARFVRGPAAPTAPVGGDPLDDDAPDVTSYLALLATLASDLEQQARGPANALALRLVRQRLVEWIEDVRSVRGHDALAHAVEAVVAKLSTALASGALTPEPLLAIAGELIALAASTPPVAPRPSSRHAFWK